MIVWTTCPRCNRRIGIAALGRDLPAHRSGLGVRCVTAKRPPRPQCRFGSPVAPQRSVEEQMAAVVSWARDDPQPMVAPTAAWSIPGDTPARQTIDWEALNRVFKSRADGVL